MGIRTFTRLALKILTQNCFRTWNLRGKSTQKIPYAKHRKELEANKHDLSKSTNHLKFCGYRCHWGDVVETKRVPRARLHDFTRNVIALFLCACVPRATVSTLDKSFSSYQIWSRVAPRRKSVKRDGKSATECLTNWVTAVATQCILSNGLSFSLSVDALVGAKRFSLPLVCLPS